MKHTAKTMANEVFLDDAGVIHGVYHGVQSGVVLQQTFEKIKTIMDVLVRQDMPIKLLIDIRDMEDYDQHGRLVEMHARTVLPFWKLAFVATAIHLEPEKISRKLTLLSGRRKQIRYFAREDDAVGWLSYMKSM